eukprot:TRINITY_DN2944_c0_g1_i1.p1 TRINITY_DN2944_c0_g1~~TRINITY_DN2944_c0_g1_i1.p1  ORF type:complete len:799 (-),score=107.84 TRINITY_DN2944_c0_g1_i1:351-2660(-)
MTQNLLDHHDREVEALRNKVRPLHDSRVNSRHELTISRQASMSSSPSSRAASIDRSFDCAKASFLKQRTKNAKCVDNVMISSAPISLAMYSRPSRKPSSGLDEIVDTQRGRILSGKSETTHAVDATKIPSHSADEVEKRLTLETLSIGDPGKSSFGSDSPNEDATSSKIPSDTPLKDPVLPTDETPCVDVFLPRNAWVVDENLEKAVAKMRHIRNSAINQKSLSSSAFLDRTTTSCSSAVPTSRRALDPQSRGKLVWDFLAAIVLLYDCVAIPLQAFDLPANHVTSFIEFFVVFYWTMDLGMSGITGKYINGKIEMRLRVVLERYLRTWFLFDVLVLIPEWVLIVIGSGDGSSPLSLARALKSTRLSRLARFLRLLRIMKASQVFREFENRINRNSVLLSFNVMKMMLGVTVLIHVLACAWYHVGKQSDDGWVHQNNIHTEAMGSRYLFAFQFSMARLHPSTFGENLSLKTVFERTLSVFVSLCALAGGGIFISSITNTMALLEAHRTMRTRKLAIIREYVKENNISTPLAVRTKKYVEESVDRKLREQNAADLVLLVSPGILTDLHREAWSPTICNHHQFRLLSVNHPKTLCNLCNQAFREIVANASELVFGVCDPCTCMFFIRAGELRYSQQEELCEDGSREGRKSNHAEEKILPGQWLSEPSLWTRWENQGNLKPAKDSTILVLHMEPFVIEIQSHERVLVEIANYCKRFLQCLNMLRDLSDNLPPSFAQEEPAEEPAQRQWKLFRRGSTLTLGSVLPEDVDASRP